MEANQSIQCDFFFQLVYLDATILILVSLYFVNHTQPREYKYMSGCLQIIDQYYSFYFLLKVLFFILIYL